MKKLDTFCMCSPNLESLFIEITNSNQPITVGVTYRPPNGDESLFHKEIDVLMKTYRLKMSLYQVILILICFHHHVKV